MVVSCSDSSVDDVEAAFAAAIMRTAESVIPLQERRILGRGWSGDARTEAELQAATDAMQTAWQRLLMDTRGPRRRNGSSLRATRVMPGAHASASNALATFTNPPSPVQYRSVTSPVAQETSSTSSFCRRGNAGAGMSEKVLSMQHGKREKSLRLFRVIVMVWLRQCSLLVDC